MNKTITTITNTCSCGNWDEETEEFTPSNDCYGDCWTDQVEYFEEITKHLFTDNNQEFRIEGFPVWYGTIDGTFHARTPEKLLESITPDRTEWRLEVTVHENLLTGRLFHHDAPTGGNITVTPFAQE